MKSLSTVLAAALVAGSCTFAMAQGSGGGSSGVGGADSTQQGTMKDADKNPTGPGANPSAGNTGSTTPVPLLPLLLDGRHLKPRMPLTRAGEHDDDF